MLTALLTRSDVSRHTQALRLLAELREALATSGDEAPASAAVDLPERSGTRALSVCASLTGPNRVYAVTTRTVAGLHNRAVLQLHDAASDKLLAVMEAGPLLALRDSLVHALAVDALARPDTVRVAVLGASSQAILTLKALRLVRSIGQVHLFDREPARRFETAMSLKSTLAMDVAEADSAEAAADGADVILVADDAALSMERLRPGAHVGVLGATGAAACPLPADVVRRARRTSELRQGASPWLGPLHASLQELLCDPRLASEHAQDVTVFASAAPPRLDCTAAWHVFEGARDDERIARLDLEA